MFPFNGGPPSGEGILVHWGQPRSVLHAILFPPKQFFSSWLRGRSEPGTFSLSESSSDCCLVAVLHNIDERYKHQSNNQESYN